MQSRLRPLAVAAMLGSAAACGPLRHGGQPPAVVVFVNESVDQADVYAVRGAGDQVRLGTVLAGRTDTLRVPSSILSAAASVNIVARVFASSRTPRTGPLTLNPGDRIQVTLPSAENILTVLPAQP